ncbi:opacity family porin [Moraxella oblonga]|uniref:opacity family porin n=1 Tax=Moraxella oblonga TaxID=200413 RepID=UPI001470734E|nr:opacity family porin [Moraxella oblonga]
MLATALAGVSTLSFANSGLYIQGDVGYSKLQYANDLTNIKTRDNGVKGTIAVGKDTGDIRYQADVSYYNDASGDHRIFNGDTVGVSYQIPTTSGTLLTGNTEGQVVRQRVNVKEVQSVGVSAIYDFETTNPMITPYAGARVGINRIKTNVQNIVKADIEVPDPNDPSNKQTVQQMLTNNNVKRKDKLGLGASAGVQFHINNQFAIDTGVEYNHLGKVDGIKGDQFGAKVGARLNF